MKNYKNQKKGIYTIPVFLENNTVLIKSAIDEDVWFPVDFKWIPVINQVVES